MLIIFYIYTSEAPICEGFILRVISSCGKKNANIGCGPQKAYSAFGRHLNTAGTRQRYTRVKPLAATRYMYCTANCWKVEMLRLVRNVGTGHASQNWNVQDVYVTKLLNYSIPKNLAWKHTKKYKRKKLMFTVLYFQFPWYYKNTNNS